MKTKTRVPKTGVVVWPGTRWGRIWTKFHAWRDGGYCTTCGRRDGEEPEWEKQQEQIMTLVQEEVLEWKSNPPLQSARTMGKKVMTVPSGVARRQRS